MPTVPEPLNERTISRALKDIQTSGKSTIWLSDRTKGLSYRCYPSGAGAWYYVYRSDVESSADGRGKVMRMLLDVNPEPTKANIAAARDKAGAFTAKINASRAERKTARTMGEQEPPAYCPATQNATGLKREQDTRATVGDAVDQYVKYYEQRAQERDPVDGNSPIHLQRKRHTANYNRSYYVNLFVGRKWNRHKQAWETLPHLTDLSALPLATVVTPTSTPILLKRRQSIQETNGAPSANRATTSFRHFIKWSINHGGHGVTINPLASIEQIPERARAVVPTSTDVKAILDALDHPTINPAFAGIVKMTLYTGMRRQEVANLRVADVDLQSGVLSITNAKTRAGVRQLALSPQVASLLAEYMANREPDEYVFSTSELGAISKPFDNWHRHLKRLKTLSGTDTNLHDNRRLASTVLSEAKVLKVVSRAILGHKMPMAIDEVYDKATHLDHQRQALTILANRVDQCR